MSCLMLNFKIPKQITIYFVLKDLREVVFLKNIHTYSYFYLNTALTHVHCPLPKKKGSFILQS